MTNKGKLLVQLAKAFTAKMYPYIFWMFVLLTSFCAFWYFEARTVEKKTPSFTFTSLLQQNFGPHYSFHKYHFCRFGWIIYILKVLNVTKSCLKKLFWFTLFLVSLMHTYMYITNRWAFQTVLCAASAYRQRPLPSKMTLSKAKTHSTMYPALGSLILSIVMIPLKTVSENPLVSEKSRWVQRLVCSPGKTAKTHIVHTVLLWKLFVWRITIFCVDFWLLVLPVCNGVNIYIHRSAE